jgi:tripartite-type tricarboxylate transporter receptor subunit TctC
MSTDFLNRRSFIQGTAAAALGASGIVAAQAETKRETARIVVGFTAGGMPDAIARRVANQLQGSYARSVVVENKTGAGGQLAVSEVARAPNDGSVLLLTPSAMLTMYPHTYKTLAYNPLADVTPVAAAANGVCALAVGPMIPASVTGIQDLVAWMKANPEKAVYASGAPGSPIHMLGVLFSRACGVPMRHISYRGTQAALVDIIAGHVPMSCSTQGEFFPHLKEGKIRVLAVNGSKRSPLLPEVRSFGEQGYPEVDSDAGFMGFYLPKGSSAATVQEAWAALGPVLQSAVVVKTMHDFGILPALASPEELGKMVRAEYDYWRTLIQRTGFTSDS